jgi:uncharacterized protein YegL
MEATSQELTSTESSVGDNSTLTLGENSTTESSVDDNSTLTLGKNSTTESSVGDNSTLTLGENSTTESSVGDNSTLTLGENSTTASSVTLPVQQNFSASVSIDPDPEDSVAGSILKSPQFGMIKFKLEKAQNSGGVIKLLFAVDISGSMFGPKINNVKKFLRDFLTLLFSKELNIILSIITFNIKATVIVEPINIYGDSAGFDSALKAVEKIRSVGGTDFTSVYETVTKEEFYGFETYMLTDGEHCSESNGALTEDGIPSMLAEYPIAKEFNYIAFGEEASLETLIKLSSPSKVFFAFTDEKELRLVYALLLEILTKKSKIATVRLISENAVFYESYTGTFVRELVLYNLPTNVEIKVPLKVINSSANTDVLMNDFVLPKKSENSNGKLHCDILSFFRQNTQSFQENTTEMNRLIQEIERSTFPVVFANYIKKILNIFIDVIGTEFENGYSHSYLMSIIQGHLCGPRINPCPIENMEMPRFNPRSRSSYAYNDSSDSDEEIQRSAGPVSSNNYSSDSDEEIQRSARPVSSDFSKPKQRACYFPTENDSINDDEDSDVPDSDVPDSDVSDSDVPDFLKGSDFEELL